MSKKLRIGVIGAGRIGKVHLESIVTQVPSAKVKSIADPFMTDETAAWAQSMGAEVITKDYSEIIADPEIDAVLICSSTDTHSKISIEAIKAGRMAGTIAQQPALIGSTAVENAVKLISGTSIAESIPVEVTLITKANA